MESKYFSRIINIPPLVWITFFRYDNFEEDDKYGEKKIGAEDKDND